MIIDWSKFDEVVHSDEVTNEELSQTESKLYVIDKVLDRSDICDIDFDAFTLSDAETALDEVFYHESESEEYEIYLGEVQIYGLYNHFNEVFRKSELQQVCLDVKKYKRKFI